ncbi:uncharacterized protein LOC123538714 [Mercenaria mercenaria]|uniref:uncharacterized protein LOC123538714 n=1 Tax=Mercenaria mercenaria TaxID=6596 RepID=UPI00234EBD45|nr:uncharacterized protein LOC123538714 [Mercenaria mercenaria]
MKIVMISALSFEVFIIMETLLAVSYSSGTKTFDVISDDGSSLPVKEYRSHLIPVKRYAIHKICRTFEGKQYLYRTMKSKFCGIGLTFTSHFVMDLCRSQHRRLLIKWVKELFDIDRDGYISHYEKNLYLFDE